MVWMEIEQIQQKLQRSATKFTAGGFRPTNELTESWMGKVFLFREDEAIPLNNRGQPMMPLAQIYLKNLPFVPKELAGIELVSIFISSVLPKPFDKMSENWLIREYTSIDNLIRKDVSPSESFLKPFPLKPEFIQNDFPLWDGGGVPYDLEKEILSLEKSGIIDSYYDIVEHCYEHKIGGYPSFCQSGIDFGKGFKFVLQICSDPKLNLNVIDNGSLMFAKNSSTGEWVLYYDFH